MKINDQTIKYAQMGRAALLPGMVHMLDVMQQQIEEFRRELEAAQALPKMRGKHRLANAVSGGRSGWPADPEARSAEMKRRLAVAKAKKKLESPEHAAWLKKLREDRKAAWAKLGPKKQKERLAKMVAGRKKRKDTPAVKLAVAS